MSDTVIIFGGPYSNFQATQAMYSEAQKMGVPASHIICTGDLVAYCGDPEATVNFLKQWGIPVAMGNCEESLAQDASDCGCGFEEGSTCSLLSSGWYAFAQQYTSMDSRHWMASLPRQIRFQFAGRRFVCVHGGFQQINQFIFQSTPEDIKQKQLIEAEADVMIGGHCGIPFGQKLESGLWLNAGVIGMPANDGTPNGWYMTLNEISHDIHISWHRLNYDTAGAQASMKEKGLDTPYAKALATGRWPSVDILPDAEKNQTGIPLSVASLTMPGQLTPSITS